MAFKRARSLPVFRKFALSAWNGGGDPSVYSFVELDVTKLPEGRSPMAYFLKALALTMSKHKEMNSILRLGRIYHRQHVYISVLVNMPKGDRSDLSIAILEHADEMSLEQIEAALNVKAREIRKERDPHLGFALKIIKWLPQPILRLFLGLYSFLTHDLRVNLRPFGLPRLPFGSVIVTNIGSLGLKKALVPLVPLTRSPLLLSVGGISKEARVVDDQIQIRRIMHIGVTFDHRFFDGSHAAAMLRDFEVSFSELIEMERPPGTP